MIDGVLAFGMPGTLEWVVILVVGLLVFGRRLPDVARSVGRSIVEFKKGMRDVQDDIDKGLHVDSPASPRLEQKTDPTSNRGTSAASASRDSKT